MAQGTDGHLVDAGDEEGSCTPRVETVGFDLVRGNVGDVLDSGSGGSQFMSDVRGGDVVKAVVAVIVGMEGSVGRSSMVLEVQDMTLASMDGTEDGVSRSPMSECFPMGGILLVSVGEGDVNPSLHIM